MAVPALLDEGTITFVHGPVTLVVAASSPSRIPEVSHAIGVRIDGARATVYVHREQADGLLRQIRVHPRLALVACRPTTLRTVQLKGVDARIVPLGGKDFEVVQHYVGLISAEFELIGHGGVYAKAMFAYSAGDLAAINFQLTAAFDQTPGPGAGKALETGPQPS